VYKDRRLESEGTADCDSSLLSLLTRKQQYQERDTGFDPNVRRIGVNVSKFLKLDRPATRITGKEGEIYFVTALTRLSDETGMFALPDCTEVGADVAHKAGARVPVLEVGDAVIWTRETAGRTTNGEGGLMHVVILA
jgi:hypothetical protein